VPEKRFTIDFEQEKRELQEMKNLFEKIVRAGGVA
jgi:ribosomal protein S17E